MNSATRRTVFYSLTLLLSFMHCGFSAVAAGLNGFSKAMRMVYCSLLPNLPSPEAIKSHTRWYRCWSLILSWIWISVL
ncbi:hypothetical protein M413DRAFT_144652 [Hebeloma cylindrosporum]|uniref:Secreted protein n=1 Tax=Hebeloma cylindrosporum TaxID=76867 RepID=A0A0C3CC91_HEBCY|nr:hypothetical protein M413DRAFT_144652 [Hebeloma cylindrosporum h7]